MITDYVREKNTENTGDMDSALNKLKAMGGNMKKLSSSYASSKSGLDTGFLNDLTKGTVDLTNQSFSGGIDLGNAGKFMAGTVGGMSTGERANETPDNIFKELIDLILGIISIPNRFQHMLQASLNSAEMLALGISGFFQSAALGITDIALLLFAILQLIAKYGLCILGFFITLAPCAVPHLITILCYIIYYWLIYMPVSVIDKFTGQTSMKTVDKALSVIAWPSVINMVCYSCLGTNTKLSDFMDDVNIISEIGDKMNSDFNVKVPRYMRPAIPASKTASQHLDAAFE
jgi:hypothetical protein